MAIFDIKNVTIPHLKYFDNTSQWLSQLTDQQVPLIIDMKQKLKRIDSEFRRLITSTSDLIGERYMTIYTTVPTPPLIIISI